MVTSSKMSQNSKSKPLSWGVVQLALWATWRIVRNKCQLQAPMSKVTGASAMAQEPTSEPNAIA
jgi:hypothetical protein